MNLKEFIKKNKRIALTIVGLVAILLILFLIRGSEDTWICADGEWVKHGNPNAPMPVESCGEEKITRKVLFYYYNPENDKDEKGNIMCSRKGLAPVEREILLSKTPIQDTIRFLLEGKLTEEEKTAGITTEYPLEGFKLLEANFKNGVLVLKFEDPLNKTSGGACRAGILWFQIEAAAKQFEEVKEVRFLPEELFQP